MLRILLLVLLGLVFALGVTAGFYNSQTVRFSYITGAVDLPLIALLLAEFGLVVALTLLVVAGRFWSLKSEIRRLSRQLRDQDAELKNLRALQPPPPPAAPPVNIPLPLAHG